MNEFRGSDLLEPLGVTNFEWETLPRAGGDPSAGRGLRPRARDMAKLGRMTLDGGMWAGRRVVSAEWIREMTTPRVTVAEGVFADLKYGRMTWIIEVKRNGKSLEVNFALGFAGQRIFMVPTSRLVVVVTADYAGDGRRESVPFGLSRSVVPTTKGGRD